MYGSQCFNVMFMSSVMSNRLVVWFSENKMKECKIETNENTNYKLFFLSIDISTSNTFGFLVNGVFLLWTNNYEPISDRITVLSFKRSKLVFIHCYIPATDENIFELYDIVQSIIDDHLFIMANFTRNVGNLHNTSPSATGKQIRNNANFLAKFCTGNNLALTNTMFQKSKFILDPHLSDYNHISFWVYQVTSVSNRMFLYFNIIFIHNQSSIIY